MPWAPILEPSLALAILKSKLQSEGIECRIIHLNLQLLKFLKPQTYDRLADLYALNDFIFTENLQDSDIAPSQLEGIGSLLKSETAKRNLGNGSQMTEEELVEFSLRLRNEVIPTYFAECLRLLPHSEPSMVGFTCMFDQTIASLALAKQIRERWPNALITFGGYALQEPCGTQILNSFPHIDVVAFGDGEDQILPLASASVQRALLAEVPGIAYRDHVGTVYLTPPSPLTNLDKSPIPNYDDFMHDIERSELEEQVIIPWDTMPVESSRGCWWGQVSHCTFCGIDDDTLRYRFKSSDTVRTMLRTLNLKYGDKYFRFSDYIMPRQYYKTLLPALSDEDPPLRLHWEMKSNVKSTEVEIMQRAGVRGVQPGIESFSSAVLTRMKKGVSAIQNIFTIKQLMQHDIVVHYNILFGFPEDRKEDYQDLCETIPKLFHLQPPFSYMPVLTTRYAPLQNGSSGVKEASRCDPAYELIFSPMHRAQIGFDLNKFCYIFERTYDLAVECTPWYAALVYQISHWTKIQSSRMVQLSYELTEKDIVFVDSRYGIYEELKAFGFEHRVVYLAIGDEIVTARELEERCSGHLTYEEICRVTEELEAERLVFREGNRFVALAFPASCYERWSKMADEIQSASNPVSSGPKA